MNPFIKLVIGMVVGATLFVNHDPGINLAILGLVLGALSLFPFHIPHIKALAFDIILYVIALFSFAWYGDGISFVAVWMSFFCLQIRIYHPQIHWFPAFFTIFLNCVTTPIRFWFFNQWIPISNTKSYLLKIIYLAVIPLMIIVVFTLTYALANTQIEDWLQHIVVSKTILKAIGISFLVFLVLFNAWFLMFPPKYVQINALFEEKPSTPSTSTHQVYFIQSAKITFVLLSLLGILFITLQSKDLFIQILPQHYSNRIHGSIAALIISLLMAIGVILIYFKNQMQPSSSTKQVFTLAYLWLALNTVLILVAFVQNAQYVHHYGFTFQRLGVFIFLMMSAFGLYLSLLKIKHQYNNAFVLNRFLRVGIITLILSAPINFSYLITTYNLKYAQVTDLQYLESLEFNHELLTPQLEKSNQAYDIQSLKRRTEQIQTHKQESFLSGKLYYYMLKP